jgi:hypothetical protein
MKEKVDKSVKDNKNCWHCKKFENQEDIQKTKCKYPNGLPIDTLEITYCATCGTVINVEW